jgi:AraC-like DNA-binding protein
MESVIRRFTPARAAANGRSAVHAVDGAEIHWIAAGRTPADVIAGSPSIHAVWGGALPLCVDNRTLRLDEDVFLVLNAGRMVSLRPRRDSTANTLSVYFGAEQLRRAIDAAPAAQREMLRSLNPAGAFCFLEHVRERDKPIEAVLRYIAHHLRNGVEDAEWYEEQMSFLLGRLLANEAALAFAVNAMGRTKSWRRRETWLRLSKITDLIHSAYERSLTMVELADAAHWSVFHMMREFKAVHGVSPYEFLQHRRTQAAARLLSCTDLSVAEIAESVGFHDRSTLMRRLRRVHGLGARALRTLAAENAQSRQRAQHISATSAASGVKSATSILQAR